MSNLGLAQSDLGKLDIAKPAKPENDIESEFSSQQLETLCLNLP